MSKPVILVADDDRLVLVTVSKGLHQAGYEVVEATDGHEAVDICKEIKPDLAILDIRMPGIDGIETAKLLNEELHTPFIIFSAYGDENYIQESIELGALGYLVKPLDIAQILPTVETALQRATDFEALHENQKNLNTALQSNRTTSTAIGIIMERYNLSNEHAFELLRKYARSQRRKISEAAEEVLGACEVLSSMHKSGN